MNGMFYNFLFFHASKVIKNKAPFRRLKLRYISSERDLRCKNTTFFEIIAFSAHFFLFFSYSILLHQLTPSFLI